MSGQYAFEKLGLLYLGRELDLQTGEESAQPLLYKNKNLTTHAAIIGMTGSGKTGLGIGIIEEAIMDNIPSIVIDPKGDMGNLLLTFPDLKAEDFAPWIDPADAARKEMEPAAYAEKTARAWQEGLASWGQDKERIRELCSRSERTIYTPGSSSGVPVSVLAGFDAPAEELAADTDTMNGLVNSTATSLLALVDIEGDPLQSREHILISSILLHYWRKGEDLSMEALIGAIVNPPFAKIGVFPLDTFYNQSDRMRLAMALNNILASPTFASWTEGEPLDIQRILYTPDGKPRTAIFSIAHLSESERMFFVTMLLNRLIGWMRRQQGSSSLKALLYMDEIFGYFPPIANPPSKKPMMLLLKQARAFGIGIVLSTQNPVDLDYKGLSNIGTWFVGRLQTRQDQEKVVEGISGASDGVLDTGTVRGMLSSMQGRQFLLNSAHLDRPLLFATRWVMSYLKGPISTGDIKKLMAQRKGTIPAEATGSGAEDLGNKRRRVLDGRPPVLSNGIEQRYYLQNVATDEVVLEPWLAAEANVRFYNSVRNIDEVKEVACRLYLDEDDAPVRWDQAEELEYPLEDCLHKGPEDGRYSALPSCIVSLKSLKVHEKTFSDFLYQQERLELFRVRSLKLESKPYEPLGDFKARIADSLREKKDLAVEKLQDKFEVKQKRLEKRIDRAMERLEKEKVDVQSKTSDTILSFGVAVVGALFGRKKISATNMGRAAQGIRNVGKVAKEKGDVKRAEDNLAELELELEELGNDLECEIDKLAASFALENYEVETFAIKPRRADIFNLQVCLLWEMVAPRT
ncbi:ATP-binding protein [Desulfopila sp. IMCC35008]|uniref:ATP-binding protein n=1 Tax=Desulfopila sp. IMCC35008 TaxID=2653858 RepID=UPI0013D381BB|nr:DUF87 domain-containing protein [Desulfopila sp. IMCC35008]